MRRLASVMLVGTVLAGSAGCSAGSSNGAAKVNQDSNGLAVQVKEQNGSGGVSTVPGATLPPDFPKNDVPLPKDAQLASASTFAGAGGKNWMLIMKVKVDASQAAADYQQLLVGAGFTVDSGASVGALLSLSVAAGPKYDVKIAGSGTVNSRTDPAGLLVTVSPHAPANG